MRRPLCETFQEVQALASCCQAELACVVQHGQSKAAAHPCTFQGATQLQELLLHCLLITAHTSGPQLLQSVPRGQRRAGIVHGWGAVGAIGASLAPFYLAVVLCGLYALCAGPLPSSFCSQPRQGESLQPVP